MRVLSAVSGPSVWAPTEFVDETIWSHDLSDRHRTALIKYGTGGSFAGLAEEFQDVAEWAGDLTLGRGFFRLRDFPIDSMSETAVERSYTGLGMLIGQPTVQDRQGSLITHIRDTGRSISHPGVRRYQTCLSQDFHSDASDVVGLLCLKPARLGGASKIMSAHAFYNRMLMQAPDLAATMYEPMPWSRHSETGSLPYFLVAPFQDTGGVPRISFIPWYIRQSQTHSEAPRLTSEQVAALNLAEQILHDPALHITMEFRPGDVQFLNNATILHSREAYTDFDDPTLRRHLLRLWLTTDNTGPERLLPHL